MKLDASVDPKTNRIGSLYIRFSEAEILTTIPLRDPNDPDILIDLDKKEQLVGIEVLGLDFMKQLCKSIVNNVPKAYRKKVRDQCVAV
jgi:uncharacterized protein YuzE